MPLSSEMGHGQVSGKRTFRQSVLCIALVAGLSACAELNTTHGYVPTQNILELIEVGRDTRSTVQVLAGRPSTTGIQDESGWFYVKSEFREFGWREREELDREVVAILFNDTGIVTNIERFGIEDGRVVPLSRRVTDDNTTGVNFLQQLFGNVGVFDTSALNDQ